MNERAGRRVGLALAVTIMLVAIGAPPAAASVADKFQMPVNPPDAEGYSILGWGHLQHEGGGVYHPGEDWNGNDGGDTDKGDPVYSTANGEVTAADDYGSGWGNIVLVKHELTTGEEVWSQYAHLEEISVSEGESVVIGQKVGTIGKGYANEYDAHLHFEIRKSDLPVDNWPKAKATILEHYYEPSVFIAAHQKPLVPCVISATGATFIEETDDCVEKGGKYWWDADGSGGHALYTYTTSDPTVDSYLKWYLDVAESGNFEFEVLVPEITNLSTKAAYKFWLPGEYWVTIDQSKFAGGWASLGVFELKAGAEMALRLDDNTGEAYVGEGGTVIGYDALRITPSVEVGMDPNALPSEADTSGTVSDDVVDGGSIESAAGSGSSGGCSTAGEAPPGKGVGAILWLLATCLLLWMRKRTA
jgi:murein DD-endopeptidase MepM/ murein hydrolase activator NlpD